MLGASDRTRQRAQAGARTQGSQVRHLCQPRRALQVSEQHTPMRGRRA
jgi:hypothetical protein